MTPVTLTIVPEWLTWLCYLSAPALVIVGFAGFAGVWLQWYSMRDSAKRQRQREALHQVREFASVCILASETVPLFQRAQIPLFSAEVSGFEKETLSSAGAEYEAKYAARLTSGEFALPLVTLVNSMEAFAHPFIHGLADEAVAFHSCGVGFCAQVALLNPYLAGFRSAKDSDGYRQFESVVALYRIWEPRIRRMKLQHRATGLVAEAESLREKAGSL
jgi:hypothetical protein